MSKTQDIVELFQQYEVGDSYNEPRDSNHWVRRFFRCWLDGSYNGEEEYHRTINYIKENKDKPKKIRSFVISNMTAFIAREFACNYSTAQKAIVKSGIDLEALNTELIDDALDLISE